MALSGNQVTRMSLYGDMMGQYGDFSTKEQAGSSWVLASIAAGWQNIDQCFDEEDFIAIMRQEANGAAGWAYWLPGNIPHGTANLKLNRTRVLNEANGNATWARWSPGVGIKNTGNLEINLRLAIAVNFALS